MVQYFVCVMYVYTASCKVGILTVCLILLIFDYMVGIANRRMWFDHPLDHAKQHISQYETLIWKECILFIYLLQFSHLKVHYLEISKKNWANKNHDKETQFHVKKTPRQ